MLYFIKCYDYCKVGYTKDSKAFFERMRKYLTHNPSFQILDIRKGKLEDEKFILAHADRLRHFHIHDCSLKANHLALGEGGLDTLRYLKMADEKDCTAVIEVKESSALLHSKNYLINHGVW